MNDVLCMIGLQVWTKRQAVKAWCMVFYYYCIAAYSLYHVYHFIDLCYVIPGDW